MLASLKNRLGFLLQMMNKAKHQDHQDMNVNQLLQSMNRQTSQLKMEVNLIDISEEEEEAYTDSLSCTQELVEDSSLLNLKNLISMLIVWITLRAQIGQ